MNENEGDNDNNKDKDLTLLRQRELDNILDAALDELDDSDSDSESESESDSDPYKSEEKEKDSGIVKGESSNSSRRVDTDDTHIGIANSIASNKPQRRPVFGPEVPPPPPPPPKSNKKNQQLNPSTKSSISSSNNNNGTDFGEPSMDEMLRQMEALLSNNGNGVNASTTTTTSNTSSTEPRTTSSNNNNKNPTSSSSTSDDVDDTVNKLMEKLSQMPFSNEPNTTMDQFEGMGDDFIQEMTREWQEAMKSTSSTSTDNNNNNNNNTNNSDGSDTDGMEQVVDGMMKQLLSKDFMYEPMKDICEKFPAWLIERKGKLKPEEYERYGKQYQCFQRIVRVYEDDPDNFLRLSELMHDIQEFGQPPLELIQELAPGLALNEDGLPIMDGMGMGGGGGDLPFPPGGGGEQCCMM